MCLVEQNRSCFRDLSLYLSSIRACDYAQPIEALSGSSVGQHTRHIIEFYQCLIRQLPSGVVNYDLRQRDLSIETHPDHALARLDLVVAALEQMDMTLPVVVEADLDGTVSVQSNAARELLYNLEHTIHHLAIIKIGLREVMPQLRLPDNFGVASSTVRFRQETVASLE